MLTSGSLSQNVAALSLRVPVDAAFVRWMKAPTMLMPRPLADVPLLAGDPRRTMLQLGGEIEWDESLPIEAELASFITRLGGAVIPRLGRKTPQDALWATAVRSLKCTSVGDVLVLLRSSDLCFGELKSAMETAEGETPVLHITLSKWVSTFYGGVGYHLRAWVTGVQPQTEQEEGGEGDADGARLVALSERFTLGYTRAQLSESDCSGPMASALVSVVEDFIEEHLLDVLVASANASAAAAAAAPSAASASAASNLDRTHELFAVDLHINKLPTPTPLAPEQPPDDEDSLVLPSASSSASAAAPVRVRLVDVAPATDFLPASASAAESAEDPVPFTWRELYSRATGSAGASQPSCRHMQAHAGLHSGSADSRAAADGRGALHALVRSLHSSAPVEAGEEGTEGGVASRQPFFDRHAAHAYPDEFFQAARSGVEARMTGPVPAPDPDPDAAAAAASEPSASSTAPVEGDLESETAAMMGSGGWSAFIDRLQAQGLFREGNDNSSDDESSDEQ
jgi:hypothetical protein